MPSWPSRPRPSPAAGKRRSVQSVMPPSYDPAQVISGVPQPFDGSGRVVEVTAEASAPSAVSFDDLYAAHYGSLTVQLFAYFGDQQEAQDVVQEAFCRALARWRTVSGYDDPVAWVRRVAWNLAVSRWRRARTALLHLRRQRPVEPQVDGPSPERVALVAALATLPQQQRRAVVLHYLADLP